MPGTTIFLRTPTLKLTIGQRNGLKFMKETNDKKEYRRAHAVLEKSEGKTHKAIAKEHGVDERKSIAFEDDHIEQKTAVSEYLDKRFGRWYDDISYDT